jgi:hypothetical protein
MCVVLPRLRLKRAHDTRGIDRSRCEVRHSSRILRDIAYLPRPIWPSTYMHAYTVWRVLHARKTIRHVRRTKASLHLDSSASSLTRTLAIPWSFNRRCPFSFLTPRRGRVISAPVSLFFSTGARPPERSTYGRRNPLLFLPPAALPFIFAGSAASSQMISGWIRVGTHFICLVSRMEKQPSPRFRGAADSVPTFRENCSWDIRRHRYLAPISIRNRYRIFNSSLARKVLDPVPSRFSRIKFRTCFVRETTQPCNASELQSLD